MIWLFERGDRVARLITRFDQTAAEYILEMEWSDGLATTERFADLSAFQSRILTLEKQLVSEEWKQATGSPELIAADWWKP
jgi:predicted Zn-dependent peptidase